MLGLSPSLRQPPRQLYFRLTMMTATKSRFQTFLQFCLSLPSPEPRVATIQPAGQKPLSTEMQVE